MRILIVLFALLAPQKAFAVEPRDVVIEAFLKQVANDPSVSTVAKDKVAATVAKYRHDPLTGGAAIMAGLREISPEFAAATQALADSQWDEGLQALAQLEGAVNPYLKAEAQFLAGRTLAQRERYEEAIARLAAVSNEPTHSLRAADAVLLQAKCLQGMLRYEQATAAYQRFLAEFPEAAKRQRNEAQAALIDLEDIEADLLPQIHSKMNFSRRRLGLEDSGEKTQAVQDEVVSLLTEMIEELEKKCGSCKGCKCAGGQKPGSGGGSGGPGQSAVTPGAPQITQRDGTKAAWGDLKQRADDPTAFNAAKKKLPAQYKDLIEQYYRSFQNEKTPTP